MYSLARRLLILLIQAYRYAVSPMLPPACRFEPSCSAYSLDAVGRYGALKGSWLTLRRICKCHPFAPGGYDPVR